jgi:signal transduction histidine kinase
MMSMSASRRRRPGRRFALWSLGAVLVALYAIMVPIHAALYGVNVLVAFLVGAALSGAPALGLRYPRTSIAVVTIAAFTQPLMVSPDRDQFWPWPWSVPALIVFVVFILVITMLHGWRLGALTLLLGLMVTLVSPLLLPDAASANAAGADLIVAASLATAAFIVGVLLAGRIQLGAELTRERENAALEQSRRELAEERTRIARELHDVVAHSMSLIQVQASTARYRAPELSDEAVAEFESIAASARAALTEMRRILGVLRTEDQTAEFAPQRGIGDVSALVETTRRAGAAITLNQIVSGDVSTASQIAIYRIVQESLSNAVRHAPNSAIDVNVTADAEDVSVVVRSTPASADRSASADRPASAAVSDGAGHGLRGMTERATLLGGELNAGPDDDGWTVAARIPRHAAENLRKGSA